MHLYTKIHYRRKVFFIKQISKREKKYGLQEGLIKSKIKKTKHHFFVDAVVAMNIWMKLGINEEKVKQIQKDEAERRIMSNEY